MMATDVDSFVWVHGPDNQARPWIMRASDVDGLSAQQIAEKFNLPKVPTRISRVDIPPGTPLRAGQVGRNIWGNSEGAIQFQIMVPKANPNWFTDIGAL